MERQAPAVWGLGFGGSGACRFVCALSLFGGPASLFAVQRVGGGPRRVWPRCDGLQAADVGATELRHPQKKNKKDTR